MSPGSGTSAASTSPASQCRPTTVTVSGRARDGRTACTEYLAPYSSGLGLSLMPPSTATNVRPPVACLTARTRYSVTIARFTIARPGSRVSRGTGSRSLAHSVVMTRRIRSAKPVRSNSASPATYGTACPRPG